MWQAVADGADVTGHRADERMYMIGCNFARLKVCSASLQDDKNFCKLVQVFATF